MFVTKRKGNKEEIDFNKIFKRIQWLVNDPYVLKNVNAFELAQIVIQSLRNGIETKDIDSYTANLSASLSTQHIEYSILAGRIVINNHHKNTLEKFSEKIELLYNRKDKRGNIHPMIDTKFYDFVKLFAEKIEERINYSRDYLFDFFGFRTLEKGYLLHIDGKIIERPQDLFMRVAIQLHIPNGEILNMERTLEKMFHAYDMMSQKYYTHATPTLFNSGTPKGQFFSCFLLGTEDSREGIMKTLDDATNISKWSGGIGFHISNWRASGSLIRGTNGQSSGIVPFLKLFNDGARAFNQGGKRMGSFACYIELHHPDIMSFLELRRTHGDENLRCRDLFLALWISDLFMERVKNNEDWSVFCPDECPNLNEVYGEEYKSLYLKYEKEGFARDVYKAREIWKQVFESQKESGMPYILYKDTINKNNMQENIGVIKSSNLCVSGDTLILTDKGYFPIKGLAECEPPVHNVWNGDVFTKATFAKTGENQELLEIETEDRNIIKCTPYHKFILPDGSRDDKEKIIDAGELKIGDTVIKFDGFYDTIKSIKKLEQLEDTYCFNEPIKNRGIFNGLLLGNCSEILEYSNSKEYAICCLASICLPKFVEDSYSEEELKQNEPERRELNHEFPIHPVMNYKKLAEIAGDVAENLNNVIENNWNPVVETARSNFKHRPIGIGIQGLADVFLKFRFPFESAEAQKINKKISEAIYYGAMSKSTELCRMLYQDIMLKFSSGEMTEYNHNIFPANVLEMYPELEKEYVVQTFKTREEIPKKLFSYSTFENSPISKGKFHWEMYGVKEDELSGLFDWDTLREHINLFGIRNSLLCAYMPTASTSQIMGCSSCFEPYLSNIYKRSTLAGEYIVINKYLMNDLQESGLWSNDIKNYLMMNNGSIQEIEGVPQSLKDLYKTVWEIKQKSIIDLASDRQPFIDQSQSMNLYMEDFNFKKFNSMQFYAWGKQLKTGSYYLRSRPAVNSQKFTIDPDIQKKMELRQTQLENEKSKTAIADEEEICLMCSS